MEYLLSHLKKSFLFHNLNHQELTQLYGIFHKIEIDKDEILIEQESLSEKFHILINGEVEVFRKDEYGESIVLARLGPGECIGEMAYFTDYRRTASVKGISKCSIIEISYKNLEQCFEIAPYIAKNFLSIVSSRLNRANLKFQETTVHNREIETSFKGLRHLMDMSEVHELRVGIDGLIKKVVITASCVMNAERATLFLVDAVNGELWSKVAQGAEEKEIRCPIGKGIAGWVVQNDKIVNIKDAYQDSRFNPDVDKTTEYRTRSILCGPIKNLQGEIIGVLQVLNKKTRHFNQADEELFKAFTYQTSIAVENFYLYKKLLVQHSKMSILLDVSNSLSQILDIDILIINIVAKVSKILNANRSSLFLLDIERGELWSKVAENSEISEIRFPKNLGIAGYVACSGKIVNVNDAYKCPCFHHGYDEKTGYKTKTVLCVPLINRNGVIIGVVEAINKNIGNFDKEDENLLAAISSQLVLTLENAQLYESANTMKKYLENVQESITNSIITLDNTNRIITANKASTSIFNPDIIQKDIRDVLGYENKYLLNKINKVYESNTPIADYDIDVMVDNKQLFFNINFFPLIDNKGLRKGLVLIFDDISPEKKIKRTLTRYMEKDIVDKILNDTTMQALGGQKTKASILFSDIRGFTGLSERLSPENIVDFLNRYFSVMADAIFNYNGILDKYIGDSIMAVFGIPYPKNSDAKRAVECALKMLDILADFNKGLLTQKQMPIEIGIGICTDDVISGNIGSEKRMDFTVIGDGVNVASRLQNLNKQYGTKILITESTMLEVADSFAIREIDNVLMKGKTHPIKIFEVLGYKGYALSESQEFFCIGLSYYRNQLFSDAEAYFEKGIKEDNICKVFFERCRNLKQHPVKPDWNGVWVSE
ncbi:MAG: GAF domain-containing protein [Desulfobacterales bacterium]|nr:GAF domain-containing protein [Desulfobacterales bacterium]